MRCPTSEPPRIGTVPNHFVVEVRANARHVAEAAVGSLDAAWLRVCDAVRARFVEPACLAGNETQAIWDRQVGSFWEVSWTSGPWSDSGNLLARRKQWRSHSPPDEPGDKCTVMHDLQELSGHVRARQARQHDEFWRHVKRHLGELDLRDNERLCAVALVKRLFPKVAPEALGWEGRSFALAVDGLCRRRALDTTRSGGHARPGARYAAAVRQCAPRDAFPMQHPPFPGLNTKAAGGFPKLDGNYLHREFVTSARRLGFPCAPAAAGPLRPAARQRAVLRNTGPRAFAETVAAGGGVAHIGSRMESGFGLVAVGVWPDAAD